MTRAVARSVERPWPTRYEIPEGRWTTPLPATWRFHDLTEVDRPMGNPMSHEDFMTNDPPPLASALEEAP